MEKQPAYNPNFNAAGGQHQPAHNPAGYGPPPAYNPAGYGAPPAYSPAGHGTAYSPNGYGHAPPAYSPAGHAYPVGHAPPAYSPGGYHPPGHTTIINNNNYHYGGGGGYVPTYVPTYHYTTHDTGSGTLGFFLGYSMGRLTTPSFHYHTNYGYDSTPRYDHYEVHHYYHNNNNVPKEAEIQPNAVVTCIGDTGSFCPAGTISLCTNNGAVMCVASATTTVPCTDVSQANCVKSTVPCLNSTAPECKGATNNTTTVSLPCISTAKIYANVTYVNNTVTIANTTAQNTTALNATVTTDNSTNFTVSSTTVLPVTTTEKPKEPQTFCVTILALPAKRELSESEKLFNSADSMFGNFAVKVLGIA